ncbi:NAD(P)-binding domain-containing protein [Agromyces sp. H3Y2-19a]|uniref:NAD(P)-dependent oxidoreductase n=1 Tax=Agromyces chromiiresistens TaxID=3030835 RepID=UPI0023B8A034|nr:NAD(P)-binding domain-containing protein [Agromyces chromiiresistens]MDF0513485.1 NAD(P)-binding domain-containing protein [Agromyces chromiiresistens]
MATIAWIGLGNMGGPMTGRLIEAGHEVVGFDLDERASRAAAGRGARVASSVAEAVADADAVFTMLPKGDHVRAVYEGDGGVWANAPRTALLLDSSTVDIETSRWCHDGSAERGFRFVDAPVSGGISGAAAGTLTFMLGGGEADVADAADFVRPMAANVFAVGGPTQGIAAKLANNMMLFISLVAAAEGSQLASSLGIDPRTFWDIARVSSADSWALRTWYPVPGIVDSAAANRNFDATFATTLALKDVSLALGAGEAAGLNLPAARLAREQFEELIADGLGGKDCSLIAKLVRADGAVAGYTA